MMASRRGTELGTGGAPRPSQIWRSSSRRLLEEATTVNRRNCEGCTWEAAALRLVDLWVKGVQ
jgi:hypothetical protein